MSNVHIVKTEFHGREFSLETGRLANQAQGAVLVRYGDTAVLVTVGVGDEKAADFLPLSVDYVEKTYAAGKIPGGYFKREGKLSEHETLTSRLIDRPCRPLFPKGFRREVQIIATVLSADPDSQPDVLAICGASAALMLSGLPFEGPIAGVRVARSSGSLVINPLEKQREETDLNMIVAGSENAIVMVEGGAREVPEDEVIESLYFAQRELQKIIELQKELISKVEIKPVEFEIPAPPEDLKEKVSSEATEKIKEIILIQDKFERRDALKDLRETLVEKLVDEADEEPEEKASFIASEIEEIYNTLVRERVLKEGARLDGRDTKTVRPITIETGILPRVHGSALFTRGQTQALVTATLGTTTEAQRLDGLMGDDEKSFMLHYNFPPYSVGEVRFLRAPGRREIGHGALAERSIKPLLPSQEEFPYVIRVVSEILESNGSSSMASVCGASLALMDAGVPMKAAAAGVAMGLINDEDGNYVILTDILGDEDHLGDMDFKVAGTEKGITALQMDIKIKGLKKEIVVEAMNQAHEARMFILGKMNEVLPQAREELSYYAPKATTFKISTEKIRDVIGPGGKTIRSITESFDVKVEIKDDGTVSIFSSDPEQTQAAIKVIKALTEEAEVGKIYTGVVKKITDFGAFVEILPGVSGLLHISQIQDGRVNKVSDIMQEGDQVPVKVLDIDRQGKIRLSRKEALKELAEK
ncbi:MAG: polyribonucleotide nucleotidyltransferase [Candidatus Dadabacteria bacterium]|nr:MAG: polyribonucleotide nucleotidyltransferase [Candidatus Dadabacteria bacterium]